MISAPSVTSCKTPIQKTFNLDLSVTRPLCTVNTAMTLLRVREDDVKEMWERGDLCFAFDIRSAGAQKMEPRIAVKAIQVYQSGYRAPLGHDPRNSSDFDLDHFLQTLWPHSRPSLRLSEIYDAFCCSSQHVLTLWREGHFGPTPDAGSHPRAARMEQRISPSVPRPLVINFLKQRRLP